MTPDEAADLLYGLTADDLDNFAARRTELVKQARVDGDKQAAAAIGKFRKPVQAAALCNLLVRTEPGAVAELSAVAAKLRDAHRHLRGDELRRLSEDRQQVLGKLTTLGRKAAGKPVGESVLNQLRATLEAAIADAAAEQAVLSGRLTAALSYSGFGEVDLSDAVALPPPLRAVPDLPGPAADAPAKRPDRGPAERALARAERNHAEALDALDEAVEALDAARTAEEELRRRIEELTAELAEARADADRAAKASVAAEREHGRSTRAVERADQALDAARAELER